MSQAKVDAHKEEKKNRQQEIKKKKRNRVLARTIVAVAVVAVAVWVGFSGYRSYQKNHEDTAITVNTSAISDYLNDLN